LGAVAKLERERAVAAEAEAARLEAVVAAVEPERDALAQRCAGLADALEAARAEAAAHTGALEAARADAGALGAAMRASAARVRAHGKAHALLKGTLTRQVLFLRSPPTPHNGPSGLFAQVDCFFNACPSGLFFWRLPKSAVFLTPAQVGKWAASR